MTINRDRLIFNNNNKIIKSKLNKNLDSNLDIIISIKYKAI